MLFLITYDVNTMNSEGQRRLRLISKACQNYGQRVQNSVFECLLTMTEYTALKINLLEIMDQEEDSIRFYHIGNKHKNKVEHFGIKPSLDLNGTLIF